VMQGAFPQSDIGDTSPIRISKLYGNEYYHWNRQFVVQVAGCPFRCPYCYVDNLVGDIEMTPEELVRWYKIFKQKVRNETQDSLHVFHLMGGCPGRYSPLWKEIRDQMDKQGCDNDIFLSDVILAEESMCRTRPWLDIPHMSVIQACLKGTTYSEFLSNTHFPGFAEAIRELEFYIPKQQAHFALIESSEAGKEWFKKLIGIPNRIDFLTVKEYEVVKARKDGKIG